MRRSLVITLATCLIACAGAALAQRADTFQARLEWVPIGGTERTDVAGEGSVTARLNGATLYVAGKFARLPAKATGAKLHIGLARGARGKGEAIGDLKVSADVSGSVTGDVQLTAEQVAALKAGRLYVQIYSEKGVQPDHSTLWGWLAP